MYLKLIIFSDPRIKNWFLMGSLWPLLLLLFSYLYFVFQCGPRYMKNRPAYKLKTFIRLYNIFQVISNAYIVNEILAVFPDATALRCVPVDYSTTPEALRVRKFENSLSQQKSIYLLPITL